MVDELQISQDSNEGVEIVIFKGDMGASDADRVMAVVSQLLADGKNRVIFDIKGVQYMSSVGLGVLAQAHKQFQVAGGSFVLLKPGKKVMELLRLTRMISILNVRHDLADALGDGT